MTILDTDLDERVIAQNALTSATEHLKSLSSSHAPTFVAVESREKHLKSNLASLLSALVETEPKVEETQKALVLDKSNDRSEKNAASSLAILADRHRLRRRTLLQHSALLELLELPSLMDACVRSNDLYDEALSIAAFANTLERRHLASSHNSAVVENVVAEIRRRELDLKRQLLSRLRGDVTMPQCLEVVTSLRRLNGVELERTGASLNTSASDLERMHATMELRLQVDFFETRDAWLDSQSSSTSNLSGMKIPSHAEVLLESIERYRTRCFEIATQFLAIFRSSSTAINTSGNNADISLLSLWTTRRIQIFLSSLSKQITKIDNCASLRDVIDATLFFANSMGRIGADFQSLLPPIFEPQLVNIVTSYWESGVEGLEKTLKVCREAGVASPLFAIMNTDNIDTNNENFDEYNIDTPLLTSSSSSSATPSPPRQLLTLPPLARFLNSYLSGLNELRRCLLPGTFLELRQLYTEIMSQVRVALEINIKLVHTPGLKGEAAKLREVAGDMKTQFDACVEPYCTNALDIAFGCVKDEPEPEPEPELDVAQQNEDEEVREGENKDNHESSDGEKNEEVEVDDDEKMNDGSNEKDVKDDTEGNLQNKLEALEIQNGDNDQVVSGTIESSPITMEEDMPQSDNDSLKAALENKNEDSFE